MAIEKKLEKATQNKENETPGEKKFRQKLEEVIGFTANSIGYGLTGAIGLLTTYNNPALSQIAKDAKSDIYGVFLCVGIACGIIGLFKSLPLEYGPAYFEDFDYFEKENQKDKGGK